MTIADELQKLQQLKDSGALTETEFNAAKRKLLSDAPPTSPMFAPVPPAARVNFDANSSAPYSIGRAANKFVNYQIIAMVIGAVIFLILLFAVFLPAFNTVQNGFNNTDPGSGFCTSPDPSSC